MKSNTWYILAAQLLITTHLVAQDQQFATMVNWKAPVQNSKKILIAAQPDKVWAVLTQMQNWPAWMSDVAKIRLNGPLAPHTTFDWKESGMHIHSTLHTVSPASRFGWTGKVYGIFAVHNWTLTSTENGTEVLVEESLEGLLAKLFHKSFNKTLERGMLKSLEELKQECEKR